MEKKYDEKQNATLKNSCFGIVGDAIHYYLDTAASEDIPYTEADIWR